MLGLGWGQGRGAHAHTHTTFHPSSSRVQSQLNGLRPAPIDRDRSPQQGLRARRGWPSLSGRISAPYLSGFGGASGARQAWVPGLVCPGRGGRANRRESAISNDKPERPPLQKALRLAKASIEGLERMTVLLDIESRSTAPERAGRGLVAPVRADCRIP